jgi:phosphatidylinositol-4,5-bisphosphate 4-phosphatase
MPQPIELNFANVQLMKPGPKLGGAFDSDMVFKQMDTFNKLAEERPLVIEIPGKGSIEVKLNPPLLFNFGSNFQRFNPLVSAFVKDKPNDARNEKSMKMLFGANLSGENIDFSKDCGLITQYLNAKPPHSDEDKQIVQTLSRQILQIWNSGDYKTNASEPYAIQSRLALLTEKLGYSTSYNCKSGKDRTGVLCMEIQHLATQMSQGHIPEPYTKLDFTQQSNLHQCLYGGAATHVTYACLGIRGLRIENPMHLFGHVETRFGNVRGELEAKDPN